MEMKAFVFLVRKSLTNVRCSRGILYLKFVKILKKIAFKFCKLTFLEVSDEANCKFA